ncbi:MAG: ABC transporter ATP-binding protein [Candidatus Omnitrophica bacterium]|nr:ABC transporter ATP-binding protein [Candidatus Omnitrophota bacterium]
MGSDPTGILLSVEDLHVRYGAVEVLKGVNLQVRQGECVALIGANGAGKSTTLMAISGLVPPVKGRIRFSGEAIDRLPAEAVVRRGVTQVPEGRRIFPRMTVMENLLLGAGQRPDRRRIAQELSEVFDLFPILRDRQRQLAGTLSGGEQQMLALARGLMARPRLLLLDEPSLGLAPKLVAQLFEVIRRIHAEGMTILLVEQNAYQALRVAETAFVLETGRVVLHGPAAALRENPAVKQAYLGG